MYVLMAENMSGQQANFPRKAGKIKRSTCMFKLIQVETLICVNGKGKRPEAKRVLH